MKCSSLIKLVLLLLVVGGIAAYVFYPRIDYAELADQQVEMAWLKGREQVPALPFFEQGGHYIDFGDGTDEEFVDRDVVVPLIRRLEQEAGMTWTVIPDQNRPGFAYAILARLPKDAAQLETMNRIISEEEAKFTGEFTEQRGHEWLSFEFKKTAEAEALRRMDEKNAS